MANSKKEAINNKDREAFKFPLDAVVMLRRQLDDRIELYESETIGKCGCCGQPIIRVNNSSASGYKSKARYYYPPTTTNAWNIFRCKKCNAVVMDNFIAI